MFILTQWTKVLFYYSYHFTKIKEEYVIATTEHGIEINALIAKENIYGTQFHPEKSHKFGLSILRAFGEKMCKKQDYSKPSNRK